MADQPIQQGTVTFDSQPGGASQQAPPNSAPPNPGNSPVTFDTTPTQPNTNNATVNATSGVGNTDYFHHDPDESLLSTVGKDIGGTVEGIGMGLGATVAGAAHLADRYAQFVSGGSVPHIPASVLQTLDDIAGKGATHGNAQNIGYGGETLTEFLLGDEALKGLSLADKYGVVSKTLKVVEKSPKMMEALKVGAKELAAQAARAGVASGAQTYVRTGGDVGAAATSGLETAATTGVLGGVVGATGYAASKLGEAGQAAGELAQTAASAPDKQTIAENIQGQLHNSKTALHVGYENGVKDLEGRLAGVEVDPKTVPIAQKAEEILQKPDPEDHSSVAQLKDIRGDKLDKPVREFLENTATGKQSITDEDIQAAEEKNANKPKILDAKGNAIETPDAEPEAQDQEPHDAHSLIQWRQQVRALAADYPPGDVNARALNRLLWDSSTHTSAFDDTFSQLADESGDPKAVSDYAALRANYRSKINIYDEPVIKNLMEGKVDDAAKAFVGTKSASGLPTAGKTEYNVQQLKTVLGDDGFTHFRNAVFDNMLKEASDTNGFNPARFISTWKRISEGTKGDLFAVEDPNINPQNYITALTQDAKTAANAQKLIRAGLIGGVGVGAGTVSPVVGAGLSTVLAFIVGHEGAGGITKGREILDYIANNPKTWAALRGIGKAANSKTANVIGKTIVKAGQAGTQQLQDNNPTFPDKSKNNVKNVYDSLAPQLGGK